LNINAKLGRSGFGRLLSISQMSSVLEKFKRFTRNHSSNENWNDKPTNSLVSN
jgi:hypothetical protein